MVFCSSELMSQLSSGAMATSGTLRLVSGGEMNSHGEIASAAMASINQILTKQTNGGPGPPHLPQHQQDLAANPYFQVSEPLLADEERLVARK